MKIVFLDDWTEGRRVFLPIHRFLSSKGVDTLFVHWGSFWHDRKRPEEEVLDGLLTRDISYYKTKLLYKVLKRENPDVVLLLTHTGILDRSVILASRKLGITCIYLMHGLLATTEESIQRHQGMMSTKMKRDRIKKLSHYLFQALPNYFYSSFLYDHYYFFKKYPYKLLAEGFRNPVKFRFIPKPSHEIQPSLVISWDNNTKDFFIRKFEFPESIIHVVGHPSMDEIHDMLNDPDIMNRIDRLQSLLGLKRDDGVVVYVGGKFVESGFPGWTDESRLNHIVEISNICTRLNKRLVIKLHPNTKGIEVLKKYLTDQVVIVEHCDTMALLHLSESVISYFSTLNNAAIALKKPLLVPRWGISKGLPLLHEGAAWLCHTSVELSEAIENYEEINIKLEDSRKEYIKRYLGHIDGKSQERINDVIYKCVIDGCEIKV